MQSTRQYKKTPKEGVIRLRRQTMQASSRQAPHPCHPCAGRQVTAKWETHSTFLARRIRRRVRSDALDGQVNLPLPFHRPNARRHYNDHCLEGQIRVTELQPHCKVHDVAKGL
jgi:hypothetical protein